jgi:hypothetical protein
MFVMRDALLLSAVAGKAGDCSTETFILPSKENKSFDICHVFLD